MYKILVGLIIVLSVSSCTTMQTSTSVLYHKYSQYEQRTDKENIIAVARDFFSKSLLGKDYRTNPDAIKQLLFKNHMVTQDSHYEKIDKQHACLTINGYDKENAPLIFSLNYISKDGRWLIDKIHVAFINNKNSFVASAKCPSEFTEL